MDGSILNDVKKIIGISEADTSFDLDLITHINTAFSVLYQLGVGPETGFFIDDAGAEWSEFVDEDLAAYNMVRSYVFLRVRMLFDPPATSFHIEAMNKQLEQYEWRISVQREWDLDPNDPMLEEGVSG